MSMKVLEEILGKDVVARMDPAEVRELADKLDAEILSDPDLSARLASVVRAAASSLQSARQT